MYKLKPHQKVTLPKMHNGCVLWGGVGAGKTVTALAYANEYEPGRPIVVATTAKVRDSLSWERTAAKMVMKVDGIEVTSWNKIQEFVDRTDCLFIFDEQKVVGSGAWVKAFLKITKKNRWILLSATPGDNWSDYSALFIANGWYANITDFRRKHAIYSRFTSYPKIESWRDEPTLHKHRKNLLVHMPMERHTTRHMHYIECDYDQELMDTVKKRRWNIYEDKPIENPAELFGVMRKVVSTDLSRRTALSELVQEHPRLVVFYNYNYELDILREICQEATRTWNATAFQSSQPTTDHGSTTEAQQDTAGQMSSPVHFSDTSEKTSPGSSESPSNSSRINRTSQEEKTESWESTTSRSSPTPTTRSDMTSTEIPETRTSSPSSPPTSSRPVRRTTATSSPLPDPASRPRTSKLPELMSTRPLTKSRSDVLLPEPTASPDVQHSSSRLTTAETGTHAETSPTASTTTASTESSEWETSSPSGTTTSAPVTEKTVTSGVDDGITSREPSDEQLEKRLLADGDVGSFGTKSDSGPSLVSTTTRLSGTSTPISPCTPGTGSKETTSLTTPLLTGVTGDPKKSEQSFTFAEWNGQKHQPVPETDRWVYLVQYMAGAEGWNCTTTDAMAFWSLTYSWKQFEQGQGRIDRLDTPFKDLDYYVLITDSPAEKPVIASLNAKKDFQPR